MATYDLVTLDEVKDFYGKVGSTSKDDDLLEDIITRISNVIESYINKNILSRSYTEYYDGLGVSTLFTKQYPIISVDSIHEDTTWVWGSDSTVGEDDYRIHNDKNHVVFLTTLGNGKQNIKIIYTAGYATVPNDIKQVCITEVIRVYKNRQEVDVLSKTLVDGSVSYSAKDLLLQSKMVLDKYKRIGVA